MAIRTDGHLNSGIGIQSIGSIPVYPYIIINMFQLINFQGLILVCSITETNIGVETKVITKSK